MAQYGKELSEEARKSANNIKSSFVSTQLLVESRFGFELTPLSSALHLARVDLRRDSLLPVRRSDSLGCAVAA